MTDEAIAAAKADIEATGDLLERALKLAGLVTTLFAERLGGKGLGRNWLICGLYVDILGLLESETDLPDRIVQTSVLPQMRRLKEEIARA